jgi:hypothetical protein
MDWPLASEYTAMLQNPAIAFVDPQLRVCRIRRDIHNQPLAICGQFAAVFQAEMPEGRRSAIRVFTSDREERSERYRRISDYLAERNDFPALVRFSYTEKSIRAVSRDGRGRLYPLIVMDWVSGDTLYDWARKRCGENAQQRLGELANRWSCLAGELEAAELGHGDLQHGNILVTEGDELKLVDYDGMCVPALLGSRNLETGMPPYQHPDRGDYTPLSPSIDRFSALFIYTALRALAAAPRLWADHVDSRNYDKLLFTRDDLANPSQSAVLRDIHRLPDREVSHWADALIEAFKGAMDDVRSLKEIGAMRATAPAIASGSQFLAGMPTADGEPIAAVSPVGKTSPPVEATSPATVAPPDLQTPQVPDLPPPDAGSAQPRGTTGATAMPARNPEPVMAWQPHCPLPVPVAAPVSPPYSAGPAATAPEATTAARADMAPGSEVLLVALRENNLMAFCENFDARFIHEHAGKFEPFGPRLIEWTSSQFRFCDRIGLAVTRGRDSVAAVPGTKNSCLIRWTWPHPRFSESCLLGLTRDPVAMKSSPNDVQLDLRRSVKRDLYESGRGIVVRLDRLTLDCQAVVWAVIDLGFETMFSEPLVLGSLRRAARGAKKSTGW